MLAISDHGAKATMANFSVQDVLEKAGLLVYKPTQEGKARQIDWSKTKAVGQRHIHVYVNTKGRDPEGIVEPGDEYEQVVQQVLDALHDYREPKTGLKPITLALTREDARCINLDSPKSGDVVYAVDPRFGKEHGEFLPTARVGIGDMRGLFIMAGPGRQAGREAGAHRAPDRRRAHHLLPHRPAGAGAGRGRRALPGARRPRSPLQGDCRACGATWSD